MIRSPEVSIIMSVYNGARYLTASIESILRQTFADFEFIIINDGSQDATATIIEKYACQDSRIKAVHQANSGLTLSLNTAVGLCSGRYIARMDADDISYPDRMRQQVRVLSGNRWVGVCHGLVDLIDADGKQIPLRRKVGFRYTPNQTDWALIWRNCVQHPTVMVRADLLHARMPCYDPEAIGCEDYKLWCRLKNVTRFITIRDPLLKYRKHKESMTSNYDTKLLRSYTSIVAHNLKEGFGLELSPDESQCLAIISGQTKLKGQKLNYHVDARFCIDLVKTVESRYLRCHRHHSALATEIARAISHQFARWAQQTFFNNRAAALQFLSAAAAYALKR